MIENQIRDTTVYSPYTHPQPAGLLSVQEYLLTDVDGVRVLLLRWIKEIGFPIDSMTYEVVTLDAVGAELGRHTVSHVASDIPSAEIGQSFTLNRGIPVEGGCMHIRVRITEVKSGAYVYRVSGTTVTADYIPEEPWTYDPKAGDGEKITDESTLRVRSKRTGKVHLLGVAAFLAVLLIAASIILPYIADVFDGAFPDETAEACRPSAQALQIL